MFLHSRLTQYLACMAIINGAKTIEEVMKTVKAGFFPVIRIMWVVSPTAMIFAQKFIPIDLWVPFFNLVQFTVGVSTMSYRSLASISDNVCRHSST